MKVKISRLVALMLLSVTCVALLASCAPASDPDKALEALKADDYVAVMLPGLGDVVDTITATKAAEDKDGNKVVEFVEIIYYKDSAAAKDAFEKISKESDEKKEENKSSNWVCKKSGAMIYFGTKNAVNAAR